MRTWSRLAVRPPLDLNMVLSVLDSNNLIRCLVAEPPTDSLQVGEEKKGRLGEFFQARPYFSISIRRALFGIVKGKLESRSLTDVGPGADFSWKYKI